MVEEMDRIRICLIGLGYEISKYQFDDSMFTKIRTVAKKLGLSIDAALTDADFFTLLEIPQIKNLSSFPTVFSYYGLLFDRGRLEIWKNGKKKKVLTLKQLSNEELLFPLYDLKHEEVSVLNIGEFEMIAIEQSIGTVLDVTVRIPNFSIDNLQFKICEVKGLGNRKFLCDVLYEEKTLFVRIPETLITNFSVYFNSQ